LYIVCQLAELFIYQLNNDDADDAVERQQMQLLSREDSPPMDFDSDEETLLRLPHDTTLPSHGQ